MDHAHTSFAAGAQHSQLHFATVQDALNTLASAMDGQRIFLPSERPWTQEELELLRRAVTVAASPRAELVVANPHPDLRIQIDCNRLHRKVHVLPPPLLDPLQSPGDFASIDADSMRRVYSFREDPERVARVLDAESIANARKLFQWIVRAEDDLYAHNLIRPYKDLIPVVLCTLKPEKVAQILEGLSAAYAARALCDDYTRIPEQRLGDILKCMSMDAVQSVVHFMLHGSDRPRRLAGVLRCAGEAFFRNLFGRLSGTSALKLLDAAERRSDACWLIRSLNQDQIENLLEIIRQDEPSVRASRRAKNISELRELSVDTDGVNHSLDPRESGWLGCGQLDSFRVGRGSHTLREVDCGRAIRIDEMLDGPFGPKRVLIDVLELDPSQVRFEFVSSDRQQRPSIRSCSSIFSSSTNDKTPSEEAFRQVSLFRLTEKAVEERALAAINGNFYFDYGHFENARILDIDCTSIPDLRFGDPIGWYVERGHEVTPAVLNRCAFVLTESGLPFIQRTKMTSIDTGSREIQWDVENSLPSAGAIALFTPLWGRTTPKAADRIEYTVVGRKLVKTTAGGDAIIPLTGFVLSLPKSALKIREDLQGAREILTRNNFPSGRGRVQEAMACGPQLVRNGVVEIDFGLEEFGAKDSSVMSFFIPRLIDRYEAARSFVAITHSNKVLLGTVSGRAFGLGNLNQPAGMTFGELAQLAQDLGAVDAMGLDGGGSSSLVAATDGKLEILNVPTGGADVPRGGERFIANAIMVHKR